MCMSTVTSGQYSQGFCADSDGVENLTSFQVVQVPGNNHLTASPSGSVTTMLDYVYAATLWAPLIQLNWQALDRPAALISTVTAYITSSATGQSASLPTVHSTSPFTAHLTCRFTAHSTSTSPPSLPGTPSSTPPSSLSTGTKITIGLTLSLAILGVITALGFWLLHRHQRSRFPMAEPSPIVATIESHPAQQGPEELKPAGAIL